MASPELRKCAVCGQNLPPAKKAGGRPRVYHDHCRKFVQLVGWIGDELSKMNPTPEKAKAIRRELWSLANTVNSKKSQK